MADTALNIAMYGLRRSLLRPRERGRTDAELLDSFVDRRNESSFEAILDRHGPMVLGLCQRVLRNEADADDAYQATFLVFVRKAASIRPRQMLGNWLYGVAHTTALKARAMKSKRAAKERAAAARPKEIVAPEASQLLLELLDRELSALPNNYRVAIVLCDLEGKSIVEAAQQLGCPQGTIASRVGRGRAMLARRLARHGIAFSGGTVALAITRHAAAASVSPVLAKSTINAAMEFAASHAAAAGAMSSTVVALSEGVMKTMLLSKIKFATATILTVVLGAGATVCLVPQLGSGFAFGPAPQFDQHAQERAGNNERKGEPPIVAVPFHSSDDDPAATKNAKDQSAPKANPRSNRPDRSKVVAWVNGRPIFEDEVILQLEMSNPAVLRKTRDKITQAYHQTLTNVIEVEIAYQEAVGKLEKGNPKVLEKLKEAVNQDFDKQARAIRKSVPEDKFQEIAPTLRRQLERQFIGMEYIRSRIFGQVNSVGNQEVKDYYDTNLNEFQKAELVKWQHAFIAVNALRPTVADAKHFGQSLLSQLPPDGDFATLAKFDDGDSKARGGAGLGNRRGEIQPAELEKYLFEMKDGQIGAVVEVSTGVHLFRLIQRDIGGQMPLNEAVQAQIRNKIQNQIFEREFKRFVGELKARAVVVIEHSN